MDEKMTLEEVITGLQNMIYSKQFISHDFNGVVDEDVCERAIELLKRQEPVRPWQVSSMYTWFKCGACHREIEDDHMFCPYCGKEIRWRD